VRPSTTERPTLVRFQTPTFHLAVECDEPATPAIPCNTVCDLHQRPTYVIFSDEATDYQLDHICETCLIRWS
jgi:hypothetical protein